MNLKKTTTYSIIGIIFINYGDFKMTLILGYIYFKLGDGGVEPIIWEPSSLADNLPKLVGEKTGTLLATEEKYIPITGVVTNFPDLGLAGLIKCLEWEDSTKKSGVARAAITLLFKEENDLIFYKYTKEIEELFDEVEPKVVELEISNAGSTQIIEEVSKINNKVLKLLEDFRQLELSGSKVGDKTEELQISDDDLDYRFKIIIVGDRGVGKTSIALRFTDNAFNRTYLQTIGVNVTKKNIRINEINIQLIIWDIAGQAKFEIMRKNFYEGAEGIFLVFDLTIPRSLENISEWHQDIKQNMKTFDRTVGFILGNKCDLVDDRHIDKDEAQSVANGLALEYIETSALTGDKIELSFKKLAEMILKLKENTPTPRAIFK